MAEERGLNISTLADFDPGLIDDALGIDKSKWRYFSLMMLKPVIKFTPKNLLDSGFGFN